MEKYLHLKCMGMITPVFRSIFAPAQIVFAVIVFATPPCFIIMFLSILDIYLPKSLIAKISKTIA